MKTAIFALALATLGSVTAAQAAPALKCWNTYDKKGSLPTVVATVLADNELGDFRVNKNENNFTRYLGTPAGRELGSLITTNRSPYKGLQEFNLAGSRLLLPARLDAASLKAEAEKNPYNGENGVIIGDSPDGDGAGSHFSVRLRCRIYE